MPGNPGVSAGRVRAVSRAAGGALRAGCLWVGLAAAAACAGVGAGEDPDPVAAEVSALIGQLDAADFRVRNDATRRLSAKGPEIVPALVGALGSDSREVRFRARSLLAQQFTFDDVVAPLIQALPQPYGPEARSILRDRALAQIEEAGSMQFAKQLFEFWGTDIEEFRRRVTFNFVDARGQREVAAIVEPLVGLRRKAAQFQDLLSRLQALSLSYDHRHSPGHVVAETLAAGLRTDDRARTEYAQRYVQAFESLADALRAQDLSRAAIRKEMTDRANMSDGACAYLVQLLDPASAPSRILAERTGITAGYLSDEFFRGLSAADPKVCYECVGKAHIADMLTAILSSWPDAPRDGLVPALCASIEATVGPGDKQKALVLLDALEACRDLRKQGLDGSHGVGQQLAHRLHMAAVISANMRDYHPVRSVHDRFLQLFAAGIAPDHTAFPQAYWQRYLRGDTAVIAEEHRTALSQYVSAVEQLVRAQVAFDHPGSRQFLLRMQDGLLGDRAAVVDAAREVGRLVEARRAPGSAGAARPPLEEALGEWVQQRKGSMQ